MANTKGLAENPYPSFMLIGDSGTHKTHFIGTCPKPAIFDFDMNLTVLRNKDVEYWTFRDAPKGSKRINKERGIYEWGTAYPRFLDKLNEVGETMDKGTCPFETLGFDSLTFLGHICLNHVLKETDHKDKDPIDQGRWGFQIRMLESIFDQLTSWAAIKVVTAHIQRDTNTVTQSIEKLPLITGKFAAKAPSYFNEVYYTEVSGKDPDPAKREFILRTVSDTVLKHAKSPMGVPDKTATDWAEVKKYVLPRGR